MEPVPVEVSLFTLLVPAVNVALPPLVRVKVNPVVPVVVKLLPPNCVTPAAPGKKVASPAATVPLIVSSPPLVRDNRLPTVLVPSETASVSLMYALPVVLRVKVAVVVLIGVPDAPMSPEPDVSPMLFEESVKAPPRNIDPEPLALMIIEPAPPDTVVLPLMVTVPLFSVLS